MNVDDRRNRRFDGPDDGCPSELRGVARSRPQHEGRQKKENRETGWKTRQVSRFFEHMKVVDGVRRCAGCASDILLCADTFGTELADGFDR